MPLSGIQIFQSFKEWIPDQNRFGNDRFELLQEALLKWQLQIIENILAFEKGHFAQFILNSQQLVVLGNAVGTAE